MRREITSLALIKAIYAQFEYKRDYIENFVPFIANLIRKHNIQRIILDQIKDFTDIFSKEFGLNIPYHPMITILDRCKKRGLFKREFDQLITISEKIKEYDFADLVVQKEARINELLQDAVDYGKNNFSLSISKDEVQNALLSYLSSHDMDIIFATQTSAILPFAKTTQNLKYVLANYVSFIKDANPEMFNIIVEIAIGHILANTILYADKLQKYSGKFVGIRFYIDVRFIFRLLGYEGDLFRNVYSELLIALREQGAELCMFNHTFEEVNGVLRGALRWIEDADFDPARASNVSKFYRNAGKNRADVQQDLATIDNRITESKICIVDSPNFLDTQDRQINETDLKTCIERIYAERIPDFDAIERQQTIEKDIKSISAIHHLRSNSHPLTIRQAQFFFLTTNSGLAYSSRQYEIEVSKGEKFIPACVTDVFIGTLVWMQSPVRWVEINQKRFLADCMALLSPTPAFIKKLVDEAQKLKDNGQLNNDEFIVLRSSLFVQKTLMRQTYGDPDAINANTLEDVINRIRCDVAAPLQQIIREKDSDVIILQQKNKAIEADKEKYKARLEDLAVFDARKLTNFVYFGLWVLFIIALAVSFIDRPSWLKKILYALSACFAILGFGFGLNIIKIRENIFLRHLSKMRDKYGISSNE